MAGTDKVICEGDNASLADATLGGSTTGVTWTDATGLGSFSPNANTLNAIFIPDPSQVGSSVKLYITSNDPAGPCDAVVDSLLVTINPIALVDAGVNKVICEADSAHLVDASFSGSATSVIWSGGLGTFSPNNTTLNAYYVPDPSETASSVVLTLTTNDPDGAGPCVVAVDQVVVTVNKAPEVNAGIDQVVCEGTDVNLNGSIAGSATGATWSTAGDGTFSFVGDLNAVYTPGATDISSGSVSLTLTTDDPAGPCIAVSDVMVVTINPIALVDAGVDKVICEADSAHLVDANIGGSATSVTWSGGLGTFSPNNTTLNAYYVPDPSETGSSVVLTLTTNDPDGAGPCVVEVDQVVVTINKAPEVNAGIDQVVCEGTDVNLNGSIAGSATGATWSTAGRRYLQLCWRLERGVYSGSNRHIQRHCHTHPDNRRSCGPMYRSQ